MPRESAPSHVACARPSRAALTWILCTSCMCGSLATAQTYTNPLEIHSTGFGADGPADPCVVEYLGTYYLYPTGNSRDYRVMLSEDLVNWRGGATAFSVQTGSSWKDGWLWAPEVQRVSGRFYLYYSAGKGGDLHVGVADSDVPQGPFIDRNVNAPLISAWSIDSGLLIEGSELYLYYAGDGSVWVRKLLDPLTVDFSVPRKKCITPDVSWEGSVNEGPYVFKRGGIYYMLYSGNGADTANYGVGAAWATHPLGPWTKQLSPYNPLIARNDAIELWGPGHGSPVIGPDGVSDWYVYHHKISSASGWPRLLALDRLVTAPRIAEAGLAWMSSGGTTAPTPAPRLPFAFSIFGGSRLPADFHIETGAWAIQNGAMAAPADGVLRIGRPVNLQDGQDFECEWWLRATTASPSESASLEFSFEADLDGRSARLGFQIRPALHAVQFVDVTSATNQPTVLASASVDPSLDWAAYFRRVAVSRCGTRWSFLIDREPLLTVEHPAPLQRRAWVRTSGMPVLLDGYRQTLVFSDDFESPTITSGRWDQLSGAWTIAPHATGGHVWRQSNMSGGFKMAICQGAAFEQFDLEADFRLLSQTTGAGLFPKHGLIHNYTDPGNYAMVFIDDQYHVLATNAIINGAFQSWVNASTPLPDTAAGGTFRHLAVTTDTETGEFVYSLNGREMLRRAYAALPPGLSGLITELSDVHVDNFRVSGSAPTTVTADFDGDGDVDQADFGHLQNCLTNPFVPPAADSSCADTNLDGLDGVDANDLARFDACRSGAGVLADRDCMAQ